MALSRHISLLFALAALSAGPAAADSVRNAYGLCAVFDATGLPSEPCSVSGWHSSVDVRLDTNSAEARAICAGVAQMAGQKGIAFDPGWKIRIYSPFSGDATLAQCPL